MKVESVHVFSLNVLGLVWLVRLFLGFSWFFVSLFVFRVFVLGQVFSLFVSFLNEESLLSAEQLLKQWIMVLFLWNLEAGGEDLFIHSTSVMVNSRISKVQLSKVDKVKNGYTEIEHAINLQRLAFQILVSRQKYTYSLLAKSNGSGRLIQQTKK